MGKPDGGRAKRQAIGASEAPSGQAKRRRVPGSEVSQPEPQEEQPPQTSPAILPVEQPLLTMGDRELLMEVIKGQKDMMSLMQSTIAVMQQMMAMHMASVPCQFTGQHMMPCTLPQQAVMQAPPTHQASVPSSASSGSIVPAQAPGPVHSPHPPGESMQLSLRQEALDFKKLTKAELDAKTETRKVYVWPLPKKCGILPPALKAYITQRTRSTRTARMDIQGVDYFFSAFNIEDTTLPILDIYKELVAQGLISQAMTLELWDDSIPWTAKMVSGMILFADWLGIHAEDLGDDRGTLLAASLTKRHLKPLQEQLLRAKDARQARRKRIDRERRCKLPPVPLQGEAVNWSIIDLHIMCDAYLPMYEKTGRIPAAVRRVINANALGAYAYRTYPGRPGELEEFPLDQMELCLKDPVAWYIIIKHHKTEATHGPLGRMVPPELKDPFKKIVKFSCRNRNLLFVPARDGTACISVNKALTAWAAVYTPGFQHPEPTLNRKSVETEIAHKDNVEKAAKMNRLIPDSMVEANQASIKAARMAGHHHTTARTYYILENGNPEQDALTSKAYIEAFKGPLPPLTPAQLEAQKTRTAKDILQDFARLASRKKDGATAELSKEDKDGEQDSKCSVNVGSGAESIVAENEQEELPDDADSSQSGDEQDSSQSGDDEDSSSDSSSSSSDNTPVFVAAEAPQADSAPAEATVAVSLGICSFIT